MVFDLQDLGIFGGLPKKFQPKGYVPNYGSSKALNPYGVPYNAMNYGGLYGQLEMEKAFAQAENGGVFGFLSEVAFGNNPPQIPKSVSEGLLGGSLGDELGKTIKPFALPFAVVLGLLLLSRGKL